MDLTNVLYKCPICRHMSNIYSGPSTDDLHISDNEDNECIICNNNILTQDNNVWVYCNLCKHRICSYCTIQIINTSTSTNNNRTNNNRELIEIYNNITYNNNEIIEIYNNIELIGINNYYNNNNNNNGHVYYLM